MGSGIFFPICAIPFSLLIIILFFKKGHVNNQETKIYEIMIVANLFGLILEILCTFASLIYSEFQIISNFIYKSYLVYLISWTSLFTLYIYKISTISTDKTKPSKKKILILLFALITIITYCLPIELVVENNFQIRYTTGKSVNFAYLISGLLIFTIIAMLIKNLKNILNKKYIPVFVFLIVGTLSIVIQNRFPQLLLLTYVETLICTIMYFTIENPDMKLLEEVHKSKEISDNANEEKTLFLYNMTQEIRNTTSEINDYANEILDSKSIEENKDSARNIKATTSKFISMTNEILDISKIDSANIKVYNSKYNIKTIIKQIVNVYSELCKNKELDFRTNIDHDIPDILYGDSIGLKEVLTIILNNSTKYTNKGYIELNINTIIKNDICRLIITIEDSGIGIKSDDINKMKIADKSLSKANKLITLMNGTMMISTNYGMGTKVKIILDQKIEIDNDTEVSKYDRVFNNINILMVDDSESGIKIIEKLLKGTDIKLDTSENGKECLDRIKTNKYNLILLDEELTQITGSELLKKIKDIRNFKTPVILLTKDNSYEYNDEYLKIGFTDYILKPVKKDILLNKIDKYTKEDK